MKKRSRMGLWTAAAALVVVVWTSGVANAQFPPPSTGAPGQPSQQNPFQPAPQPAGDPRVDQVKKNLEQQGVRVVDARFLPAKDNRPPAWSVIVVANYAQPSFEKVGGLAFFMFGTMFNVAQQDPPATTLFSGQVWTKYQIIFLTTLGEVTKFATAMRAAGSDQEKQQAVSAFLDTWKFGVYDTERGQFVDQKDFVNKNFAR